jgi:hypothetical protein
MISNQGRELKTMTDIHFSASLHKSSAAFAGTAHPRFKQIPNMACRILDKHTTGQKTEIHTALLNAHTVRQTAARRPYQQQERNLNRLWLESKGKVQTMKVAPSSLSCEIYTWSNTFIFAADSSTLSLTGIGTHSSSFSS